MSTNAGTTRIAMRFMRVCSYNLENASIRIESFEIRSAQSYSKYAGLLERLEPFHFARREVAPLPRFEAAHGDGTHANPAQIANWQPYGAAHFSDLAVPSFTNCNR
jgi:hypothetical protein